MPTSSATEFILETRLNTRKTDELIRAVSGRHACIHLARRDRPGVAEQLAEQQSHWILTDGSELNHDTRKPRVLFLQDQCPFTRDRRLDPGEKERVNPARFDKLADLIGRHLNDRPEAGEDVSPGGPVAGKVGRSDTRGETRDIARHHHAIAIVDHPAEWLLGFDPQPVRVGTFQVLRASGDLQVPELRDQDEPERNHQGHEQDRPVNRKRPAWRESRGRRRHRQSLPNRIWIRDRSLSVNLRTTQ